MRMKFYYIFGLALTVTIVIILIALQPSWPRYPKPGLYPNAVNVVKYEENPIMRVTTFSTPDSPESVFTYYKAVLIKEGWEFDENSTNSDYLHFLYIKGSMEAPAYGLYLKAEKTSNSKTFVEIKQRLSGHIVEWPDNNW